MRITLKSSVVVKRRRAIEVHVMVHTGFAKVGIAFERHVVSSKVNPRTVVIR